MFIVIAIIMLLMLGLLTYYIANKLHGGIKAVLPKAPLWAVLVPLLLLTVCTLLGFMRITAFPTVVKGVLEVISAYWMGAFVYLLLFCILADIVALILKLFKLPFVKNALFKGISAALVLVLAITTVVCGICNARDIDHISYEIKVDSVTDVSDLNIALISDVHLGAVGSESRLAEIVDEINSLNPDLVLIAGDFFDTTYSAIKNPQKAIKTISRIEATFGTYACLGNHDAGETFNQMQNFLKQSNVILLNDSYTVIDNRLILVGRLDAHSIGGYGDLKRKPFAEIGLKNDENLPVIVMEHNPQNIGEYNSDVDLIVCGHTHKGQIFPANIITSLVYDVDHGYYRKNPQSPQVIVTSGVGYWGMPMRVGTNSEIVSIKLI
ncbi:MAG: metallophosphoesterase [Clostridia bacterium]|nr:metallophosphoesterase [Clostridia bacterium]